MKQQETRDIYMIRSFIICTLTHILFIVIKSRTRWARQRIGNANTIFQKNLKGKDHLGDLGVDEMII
jgi:hypothetical protein